MRSNLAYRMLQFRRNRVQIFLGDKHHGRYEEITRWQETQAKSTAKPTSKLANTKVTASKLTSATNAGGTWGGG